MNHHRALLAGCVLLLGSACSEQSQMPQTQEAPATAAPDRRAHPGSESTGVSQEIPEDPADSPNSSNRPLNLSRDVLPPTDSTHEQGIVAIDDREADMLPGLFENEEKRMRTKSKLLMREDATGMRDAVEGLEVSIEIKTK